MPPHHLPARSEIPARDTWDAASVFASTEAWEAEYRRVQEAMGDVREFQGHLGDGPEQLADFMAAAQGLLEPLGRLVVYATMFSAVDSGDQAAEARTDRARSLASRVQAALAFAEPELIALGSARLLEWAGASERLAVYRHHFERVTRRAEHVRSAEVEEVLSLAAEPLGGVAAIHGVLANLELAFAPAHGPGGDTYEVAQGTYQDLLASPDRDIRRTAWESYSDAHLAAQATMAACLSAGVRRDVFYARARRYPDSLTAALEPNFVPVQVYHQMLDEYRANLPTWHRYWRLRRRALGLGEQHVYDTRATLGHHRAEVPYEQAVEWIAEGLAPLGDDYVQALRRGAFEERWVDRRPSRGKRMGAFSMGTAGTRPFIFMSYSPNLLSLSTLAHELGHSMHSYYTRETQPYVYANYTLFVAEVASNFQQAMVRAHLLKKSSDPSFQVAVIEEAMANFHRYFFVMPTLARFELEIHERVERGEALTADGMTQLMHELLDEAYGGEVTYRDDADRRRSGSTWMQFHTHLYSNFYVYQYATGIAGAHWLADRVLSGETGAAQDYLAFVKAGSSLYPLDALRLAGVDMTSPEPVRKAFGVLSSYVDRLERLLGD